MSEITRLLTEELQMLRTEDRAREERLIQLLEMHTQHVSDLAAQVQRLQTQLSDLQTRFDSWPRM